MIDWHSHILPCVDDGSRDLQESLALIKAEAAQGVSVVLATPHFYANDETVDTFLQRRDAAAELLKANLPQAAPQILLGAEVKYYPGISRMENLKALRIEGTKLLLLEMPMAVWGESAVRELIELSGKSGIRLVLAHVERYLNLQKADVWQRLCENGILFQVNASFFISLGTRRKALSLLKNGKIHVLGSDCHNLAARPPKLDKAFEAIQKKFGDECINQLNEYGHSLLFNK